MLWICIFGLVLQTLAQEDRTWRTENCCQYAGCFNNNPPLDHLEAPACPETLNIKYPLYTRNNRDSADAVSRTQIGPNFSGSRRTIFITHGWNANIENDWVVEMKNNLLNQGDYNVILTDWRDSANDIYYPQAAANTRAVGAENALVYRNLVDNGGASYSRIYCMGHSLGGHVCGHSGKRAESPIGRITAFDPAGVLFENYDVSGRVDKNDASFVDVIHTASEGFTTINTGIDKAIGHVDFYVNNGYCQPGCDDCSQPLVKNGLRIPACSHGRGMIYFIEALRTGCPFTSYPCSSKADANNGVCNSCDGNCQTMTINSENNSGRGTYYLNVNSSPPWCKG